MRRTFIATLLTAGALVATNASAEPVLTSTVAFEELLPFGEIEDVSELSLEGLLGTVTAASRTRESRMKAPATVSVFGREQIRLSGARTLPDLLRQIPGVQVTRNAQGSWIVSLRGTGGLQTNNLVVLLDGVPLNSVVDASVDWSSISVDIRELERIEVVRGPVSTIYGANAYTGVVSLISTSGEGIRKPGVDAAIASGYASGLAASSFGAVRGELGNSARYKVSATAGVSRVHEEETRPELEHAAGHVIVEKDIGEVQAKLTINGGQANRVVLDHLALTGHELGATQAQVGPQLRWDAFGAWLESAELWTRGSWSTLQGHEGAVENFSYAGVSTLQGALGLDARFRLGEETKLLIGADSGLFRVDAPFMHPDENGRVRQSYGLYANASTTLWESVALSIGARTDRSAMVVDPQLSFRGSITYFTDSYSLRVSAGTAYRQPSMIEVGSRLIEPKTSLILLEGDPALVPPRLDSVELAAIFALGPAVTITPTIFIEQLRNSLLPDFGPIVRRTFSNDLEKHVIAGAELEAEVRPTSWLTARVAGAGLTAVGDDQDTGGSHGVVHGGNAALSVIAGLRFSLLEGRLGLGLDASYLSQRSYDLRVGIPPRLVSAEIPAHVFLSGALEWQPLEGESLWTSLKVHSQAPNVAESPFSGAVAQGTEAFVSLEWRSE